MWVQRYNFKNYVLTKWWIKLAAEELVFQMANQLALQELAIFIKNPTMKNASVLTCIPALCTTLLHEYMTLKSVSDALLCICGWLYDWGRDVFLSLVQHNNQLPSVNLELISTEDEWIEVSNFSIDQWLSLNLLSNKTGCHYSLPPVERWQWKARHKMFKILVTFWKARSNRWAYVHLVHPQHLLWLSLHPEWGRMQWCIFSHHHMLAKGTEKNHLWLCMCPWSILHDPQTSFFFCRYTFCYQWLPCKGSHKMFISSISQLIL